MNNPWPKKFSGRWGWLKSAVVFIAVIAGLAAFPGVLNAPPESNASLAPVRAVVTGAPTHRISYATPRSTPKPTPKPAVRQSVTVYIATYSGTKYHSHAGCRGLKKSNSTAPISKDDAIDTGYDPCAICW